MRDLDELEAQGYAIRQRGGAMLKERAAVLTKQNEPAVRNKEFLQEEAKTSIARRLGPTIQEGDCIYLDGGTTTTFLVDYIKDKNVTLVTPNTYLLRKLPDGFPGKIFLLGGEYDTSYDMSYGPLARMLISRFRFDACFMSANGLSLADEECTVFDFGIGEVKQEIMARSVRKVLMADATKFDQKGMCVFASLQDFDAVYVDKLPEWSDAPENFVICNEEAQEDTEKEKVK